MRFDPVSLALVERSNRPPVNNPRGGVHPGSPDAVMIASDLSSAHTIRPDYPDALLVHGVFSEPYRE